MTRLTSEGRSTFNYPDRGATARRPLPAGYDITHHRTRIGQGQAAFDAAGAAVTTFRAHRASGMLVTAGGSPSAPVTGPWSGSGSARCGSTPRAR